jgi:3-dehydroquinate synthase
VDSSIGGKTGVDTAAGKNLLGTFNQPKGVFIDIAFLRTLPDEMFRSGLAEVIKYGIIESPGLLDDLEEAVANGDLRKTAFLERIIATACRIKKEIVELDERDRGLRRILNFGHTVGHAVEAASGYALSHGESVAIGMVAAVRLSERLHGLPADDAARIAALIRSVGLPDRIPAEMDLEDILSRLSLDKKKEGGTIHFVMIRKLGTPFVNGGIPEEILRDALKGLKP